MLWNGGIFIRKYFEYSGQVLMKRPVVIWAVLYASGILASLTKQSVSFMIILSIFLISLCCFLNIGKVWTASFAVCIWFAFFAANRYVVQLLPIENVFLQDVKSVKCECDGTVEKVMSYDDYEKLYVKNVSASVNGNDYTVGGMVVTAYDKANLQKGDKVHIIGDLSEFETSVNEGQFDSKAYYFSLGYSYKISADDVSLTVKAGRLQAFLNILKYNISAVYDRMDDSEHAGIYKSIVLGSREELDVNVKELYAASGISHILAISALHISVVGMTLYKVLRRNGVNFLNSAILCLLIILIYGNITGNSVSVIRAVIMFGFFLFANVLGRTYDMMTAASFSCIFILMANPLMIINSGFLLSFSSVAAICIVSPVFSEAVFYALDSFMKENTHFKTILRGVKYLLGGVITSLSVSISTFPIIAYNYFDAPVYSVLLNIVVVPLMGLVMTGALLAGIFGMYSLLAGRIFIGIAHYILDFYEILCNAALKFPKATVCVGRPQCSGIIVYYVCLLTVLLVLKYKKKNMFWIPVITFVMFFAVLSHDNNKSYVTMLDVSQGECIYINIDGNHNMMVDCGSSDLKNAGKYRIIPYLKANRIKRIEYVFLTHPDADHVNALHELLENDIAVENVIVSERFTSDENGIELVELLKSKGIAVKETMAGESFKVGGSSINILFPDKSFFSDNRNDNSLVFELITGGKKMLFTGDIGSRSENYLAGQGLTFEYDVLKVAHHGSSGSSTESFIRAVNPQISLISCGKFNRYGHPAQSTLEKLKNAESDIYITANVGQIKLILWKGDISVEEYVKTKNILLR